MLEELVRGGRECVAAEGPSRGEVARLQELGIASFDTGALQVAMN